MARALTQRLPAKAVGAGGLSLWDMSLPPGQCTPNSTLNALHSTGGTNLLRGHLGGPSDKLQEPPPAALGTLTRLATLLPRLARLQGYPFLQRPGQETARSPASATMGTPWLSQV